MAYTTGINLCSDSIQKILFLLPKKRGIFSEVKMPENLNYRVSGTKLSKIIDKIQFFVLKDRFLSIHFLPARAPDAFLVSGLLL